MDEPEYFEVFIEGHDGYHTYRIPAVIVTQKGTLLAFAEGRASRGDQSANDMVLKRSLDNGETWEKMQVIAEFGEDSINNPQPVIVEDSGKIILFFQIFPYPANTKALVPGYEDPGGEEASYINKPPFIQVLPRRVTKAYYITSDDDGVTWSDPVDISRQVKRPEIPSLSSGPGIGIQLRRDKHAGRIIMPFNQGPWNDWRVYAAYSDDQGKTWAYGDIAPEPETMEGHANEVQMVELVDGTIMLNARIQGGNKLRKISYSKDAGETWSPLEDDPALIEPVCQASLIRYTDPLDGYKSRLLFSNPATQTKRINGTVYMSYDEGKTWPVSKVICDGNFAYSCLTVLPDYKIGCLFETGVKDAYQVLTFARFTIAWLSDGKDSLKE
ncbi:MAG: exo-alpha-sialidase [Candidatus Hodarchaeota archaeon]